MSKTTIAAWTRLHRTSTIDHAILALACKPWKSLLFAMKRNILVDATKHNIILDLRAYTKLLSASDPYFGDVVQMYYDLHILGSINLSEYSFSTYRGGNDL